MSKPHASVGQPLGAFVSDLAQPALAARGLSEASLVSHWPEIVGSRVAAIAQPERLQWPPRGDKRDPDGPSAPGVLVLRVDGAFALEVSHMSPVLIARVNAHLGWRCIDKIAFRQGPLGPAKPKAARPSPPSAEALARAADMTRGVADDGLREALTRLGARAIDNAAPKR